MKGTEEKRIQLTRKINNLIKQNPELRNVYAYMTDLTLTTCHTYLYQIQRFREYTNFKHPRKLEINDFTNYLLKSKTKADGTETVSSYHIVRYQALKRYGDYLEVRGYVKENPMNKVKRPAAKDNQATIEKRERSYLTEEEIRQYIANIKNYKDSLVYQYKNYNIQTRDLAIIMVFLTTGIRGSALQALNVEDINFEEQALYVTDKGEKVHKYYLQSTTLNALQDWLREREHWLKRHNLTNKIDALFISIWGKRMSYDTLSLTTQKYAGEFKGKTISPHKLRATYGTQLYNNTKDIYFVQQCMHHSSPLTTERYIRGQKNSTKEAASILENLF